MCEVGSRWVRTPRLGLDPGVVQRQEPVGVEALVAKPTVERLDEDVIGGLTRSTDVQRDPIDVGPVIECPRDELGAVVDPDLPRWPTALEEQAVITSTTCSPLMPLIDPDCEALAGVGVDDCKGPEPLAVEQSVGDEVHRPNLFRPRP